MSGLVDAALVLVVLTNLAMLGTNNMANSIRLLALQGVALGASVAVIAPDAGARTLLLAVGVASLKGVLYPWALLRVLRKVKATSEDQPLVGYTLTFLTGIVALGAGFVIAGRLPPLSSGASALALPVAVATIVAGLALTITRRTALAQVLGYVVLENGIFLFALVLVGGLPLLLELGGLLEVFFAVFVMGIAVDRISREFATTDVNGLDRLRG